MVTIQAGKAPIVLISQWQNWDKQEFEKFGIFFPWWYIFVKSEEAPCMLTLVYHIGDTF